ncbi:MAG TPA: signal recognition particle receptor subunit alpha, partial [Burkholderiaceae bacterium]|nr:signal recognition particle receptor subunit alpha [Burkholderiaceae bacterium]
MISPGSSGGSKSGWLNRLRSGLSKTRVNIVGLFSGGVVDEEFLEQLEFALIGADTGVATAEHLIDALRSRIKLHGLLTQDEVRRALVDEITQLLAP